MALLIGMLFAATKSCNSADDDDLTAMRNGAISDSHITLSPGSYRDSSLKIAIVYKSQTRVAIIEDGLHDAGLTQIERISEMRNLLLRVSSFDPDVILIDLENPSRDTLAQMFQVSRAARRPVAIFVDQSDSTSTQAAVDAGVAAYIVDGLKKERITAIVDLAISRFNAFSQLQAELDSVKSTLNERKVIDRAKGMLMKARRLSEDEAYVLMRRTAMSENKKIVEIARSVIKEAELLK